MKTKLIYFAILLLACIAGIEGQVFAQCGFASSPVVVCFTGGSNTAILNTGGASGTWVSNNTGVVSVSNPGPSTTTTVTYAGPGVTTITFNDGTPCDIDVKAGPTGGNVTPTSASLCENGTTVNYSSDYPGGTWSSSAPTIVSIDAFGVATGLNPGTALIIYTTAECGGASPGRLVTVNQLPRITGTTNICMPGGATTLAGTAPGGTWSGSTSVANVSAGGNVTAVSAGLCTVMYTTTSAGCATKTASAVVSVLPYVDAIHGPTVVCVSSSIQLTDASPGGNWSSAGVHASVTSTGLVNGTSAGIETITYTVVSSCGPPQKAYYTVQVDGTNSFITGPTNVCITNSSASLAGFSPGGSWTTDVTAVATIDPATGVITPVTAGATTITYSALNSCNNYTTPFVVQRPLVIDPIPVAGTVTGPSTVCGNATATMADITGTPGGTWSTANTLLAAVDPLTGVVTPIAATAGVNTAIITYTIINTCGNTNAQAPITIFPVPAAGTISGTFVLCATGGGTTLTESIPAGTWAYGSGSVATINAATGVVTCVSEGIETISYTVPPNGYGCTATTTQDITLQGLPNPGDLYSYFTVCEGATLQISDEFGDAGGSWSSSTGAASVDATGLVTGISPGTTQISYTVTNSCMTPVATYTVVTVETAPDAGTISGPSNVCERAEITLTSDKPDGGWSTTFTTASVTLTPTIRGITAGTAQITYHVTNTCGTDYTYYVITIDAAADPGTVTGTATVCVGATTALADATGDTPGTWTSDAPSTASVNPGTGVVTGVAAGQAIISYGVTDGGSCGMQYATKQVTVNPLPDAGILSNTNNPYYGHICVTYTGTVVTTGDPGGTWSSSDMSKVIMSSGGYVGGIATTYNVGTATITYEVSNSCGSDTSTYIQFIDAPATTPTITPSIAGGATLVGPSGGWLELCNTSTLTLTGSPAGGIWTAGNTTIATINNTTGVVTFQATSTTAVWEPTGFAYAIISACGYNPAAYSGIAIAFDNPSYTPTINGGTPVTVSTTESYFADTYSGLPGNSFVFHLSTSSGPSASGTVDPIDAGKYNITFPSTPGVYYLNVDWTNTCGTYYTTSPGYRIESQY